MKYSRNAHPPARLLRWYSKKYDPMILAEVLGLLSPSKSNYKPSLLQNLLKGPVTEQHKSIKNYLLRQYTIPKIDHHKNMGGLMENLQAAVGIAPRLSTKDANLNLKSLTEEDELLDLVRLSYYQNELTPQLLTKLLLNRNLRNLSRLPFDVQNLDKTAFKKNNWAPIHFVQFKILLMKKYHDLRKPLQIIKLLNSLLLSSFLPLIREGTLLPFYERIVWKFCFEYLDQYEETSMIEELDCLRSSVLVWETSLHNNRAISAKILSFHDLQPLPRLFFELASCQPLQEAINTELASGASPTLSELKKISSKCKFYKVVSLCTVIERALAYHLIHSLDNFLEARIAVAQDPAPLREFLAKLAGERKKMIAQSESLELASDVKVFTE